MTTYEALVRRVQPKGYPEAYWAGVTRKVGSTRATDICRHQHTTQEEAQTCADKLAAARN